VNGEGWGQKTPETWDQWSNRTVQIHYQNGCRRMLQQPLHSPPYFFVTLQASLRKDLRSLVMCGLETAALIEGLLSGQNPSATLLTPSTTRPIPSSEPPEPGSPVPETPKPFDPKQISPHQAIHFPCRRAKRLCSALLKRSKGLSIDKPASGPPFARTRSVRISRFGPAVAPAGSMFISRCRLAKSHSSQFEQKQTAPKTAASAVRPSLRD